jgi:hypothetical protein
VHALRWLLLLLPTVAWLSTCTMVAWPIYVDSGDPVSVVVRRGPGFDIVEVAGRDPFTLPPDVVPVIDSEARWIASGQIPDPATGQKRTCNLWNPTDPAHRARPDTCYRLSGGIGLLQYRPGLVDDAGSLFEDRYRVDGQVVTPESTKRLTFGSTLFGWIAANIAGALAALIARGLRGLLQHALPAPEDEE